MRNTVAISLVYDNITIRGITYKQYGSFVCYASNGGTASSDGTGSSATALEKGKTYYIYAKAIGDNNNIVTHPYAVCESKSPDAIKGWYKEDIFPYATYTVSYNANGGSNAPSSQTKIYNTALTLSNVKPTRTGYTFVGWGTSSADTTVDYYAGGSYTKNAAITLYAIWSEHALTVNYYSNYATESFAEALNAVGADKNVIVRTSDFYYDNDYSTNGHWDYSFKDSSTYLGRTGYTATGYWGTSPSGGTLVKQSDPYASGQAMAEAVGKSLKNGNASVNLYAQWQKNIYKIAYNANGGSGNITTQGVYWNETFTVSDNLFSREGYKFLGWNLHRSDGKWYVSSHGWMTEEEIIDGGYQRAVYAPSLELTLGEYWINEDDSARLFTFYAIWEISGVVYIDNETTFEPYLAYIDNGVDWDLYLAYVDNGTDWNIIS